MTTIDERVVSLKFDNAQFEANAQRSIGTLDKLKAASDLRNAARSIGLVGRIGRRLSMIGLTKGLDAARQSFSALEVMGITALANITNSAVNAGMRIARAFTIQPVMDGFSEYELKMNSVQTIMASTGADIGTVNEQLNMLNEYADKTIYSFSDMTQNIGKFTNAGVPLKDAVKAIQGISNEAAVSGANANQASHAMYNFAQALSQGSVKLIDWKSIENAQMATLEFKNELISTAVEMGTLVKEGDMYKSTTKDMQGKTSEAFNATKMFNESLSSQWMTTDVLVETLGRYADETTDIGKKAFAAAKDVKTFSQLIDTLKEAVGSGWAMTFEHIFGDKEEAKNMWTNVNEVLSNVVDKMSDARNDMLESWKALGGRNDMIEAASNLYKGFLSVITPIRDAFRDIFPPMTAKRLVEITANFKDFTAKLKLSDEQSRNLRDTFKGFFTIFRTGFKAIGSFIGPLAKVFSIGANIILSITGAMGRFITGASNVTGVGSELRDMLSALTDIGHNLASTFTDGIATAFEAVASAFDKLGGALKKATEKSIGESIKGAFSKIGEVIKQCIDVLLGQAKIVDVMNSILSGGIMVALTSFTVSLAGITKNVKVFTGKLNSSFGRFGLIVEAFKSTALAPIKVIGDTLGVVRDVLLTWQKSLKADILLQIAAAIGIVALSLALLASIDPERLSGALAAMMSLVTDLMIGPYALSKMELTGILKAGALTQLIAFAAALAILAATMKSIGDMDMKSILKGMIAMHILIKMLTATMAELGGINFVKYNKKLEKVKAVSALSGVLALAISIAIIGEELQRIARMDWAGIAKGLVGIGSVMAMLYLFAKKMNEADAAFGNINTMSIVPIAVSLVIIGKAMEIIAGIRPGGAVQALISMVIFMDAYTDLMQSLLDVPGIDSARIIAVGATIILVAEAFKIFAKAMTAFEGLSWSALVSGLGSFATMITGVTAALSMIEFFEVDTKSIIALGVTLLALSVSFKIFADAIKSFEGIQWQTLVAGLVSFGSMIGGVIAAMAMIGHFKINPVEMLAVSGALVAASASFVLIAMAMNMMKGMNLAGIAAGVTALASVLIVFAGAANMVTPAMLLNMNALAEVFAVLSVSMMMFAPAMLTLSTIPFNGIAAATLALASVLIVFAGAATLFEAALPGMVMAGLVFIELGAAFALAGVGIAAICHGLVDLTSAVVMFSVITGEQARMASQNIVTVISTLLTLLPQIAGAISKALLVMVHEITKNIGPIITDLITILKEFVVQVVDLVPFFVKAGADIIVGLIDGLNEKIPEIVVKAGELITILTTSIVSRIGDVVNAGLDLIIGLVKGVGEGLKSHTPEIIEAVRTFVEGLTVSLGGVIEGVLQGLGRGIGEAIANILKGAMQSLPEMGTMLSQFADNAKSFFTEISGLDPSVMLGVKYLAQAIALLVTSDLLKNNIYSRLLTMGSSFADLGEQLSEFAYSIEGIQVNPATLFSVQMLVRVIQAVSNAAQNIPKTGGLLDGIFGSKDLVKFGDKIVTVAESLMPLSVMTGLNEQLGEKIQNVVKIISDMATAAKSIPKIGGLKTIIFGNDDLTLFTSKIVNSANALSSVKNLPEFDESITDKINTTLTIITQVTELVKHVPKTGGLKAIVNGEHDIRPIAQMVHQSVVSLSSLHEVVGKTSINQDLVDRVGLILTSVKQVWEVAKTLPKTGGLKQVVDGQQDIRPFVDMIKQSVASLSGLYDVIGKTSINEQLVHRVDLIVQAIKSVSSIVDKLPKTGGFKPFGDKIANGEYDIMPFTNMIKNSVTALSGLHAVVGRTIINETLANQIKIVTNVIKTVVDIQKDLPKQSSNKEYEPYDVSGFVEMVAASARILTNISRGDALKNIDEDLVSKLSLVTGVIKRVSEISASIPMVKTGKNGETEKYYDISGFIRMLTKSAQTISDAVKDSSFDGITDEVIGQLSLVTSVIQSVTSISKNLTGDTFGNPTGVVNLDPFVDSIISAAKSISEFAAEADLTVIDDTLVGKLTMVTGVIRRISEVSKSLMSTTDGGQVATTYISFKPYIDTIIQSTRDLAGLAGEKLDGIDDTFVGKLTMVTGVVKRVSQLAQSLGTDATSGGVFTTNTMPMSIQPYVDMIIEATTSLTGLATGSVNLDAINETFVGKLTTVTAVIKRVMQVAASLGQTNGGSFAAINNFIKSKIDIASMVSKIKDMVKAVKKLTNIDTGGLDLGSTGKLYVIKSAVEQLGEVAKSVKAVKIDKSASASGLVDLGKNLKKAVPYFVDFTTQAGKVKTANAERVKNVVETMKGVKGAGDGASFKKLGANLKSLGRNMAEFSSTMDAVDAGTIAEKLNSIAEIKVDGSHFEAFGKAVKKSLTNAVKAINSAAKNFKTGGTKCAKAMVAGAKSQAKSMSTAGKNAGAKFVSGVKSKTSSARAAGKSLTSAAKSGAGEGGYSGMYTIGENLGTGLVNGLNSTLDDIRAVSSQIAAEVDKAMRKKAEIKSPSRMTMRTGAYLGKGLIVGYTKESKKLLKQVDTSFAKVTKRASKGAKTAVKAVSKNFYGAIKKYGQKQFNVKNNPFENALLIYDRGMKKRLDSINKNLSKYNGKPIGASFAKAFNDGYVAAAAKYDPFNRMFLTANKNAKSFGTVTATYIAASIKNSKLQNTAAWLGTDFINRFNKSINKLAKKTNNGKVTENLIKTQTKALIKTLKVTYRQMQPFTKKISTSLSKAEQSVFANTGAFQGGFASRWKTVTKSMPGVVKAYNRTFNAKAYGLNSKVLNKAVSKYNNSLSSLTKQRDNVSKRLNNAKKTGSPEAKPLQKQLKGLNKAINNIKKQSSKIRGLKKELNAFKGGSIIQSFANTLYMNSADFKQVEKDVKKQTASIVNAQNKIKANNKKIKRDQDKVKSINKEIKKLDTKDNKDNKKIQKNIKKLKSQKKNLKSEIKNLQNSNVELNKTIRDSEKALNSLGKTVSQGATKALREFRNEIKQNIRAVGQLSSINLAEKLFSGFNLEDKNEEFDAFGSTTAKTLNGISNSIANVSKQTLQAITAAEEAYDILSNSFSTGLNLLEKFTKTGTAEPAALIEHAQTQLDAFQELYDGLDKMQAMGFSQTLINELEEQGISGLNYVRGFLEMSADQVNKYNAQLAQKETYEQMMLERHAKKQAEEFDTWVKNIGDLETKLTNEVGKEFVKKLKAAGVSQANMVAMLVKIPADALERFAEYYGKSISGTVVNFTKELTNVSESEISKSAEVSGSNSGNAFLDGLIDSLANSQSFENKLAQLASMGYSKHVIESFRQAGEEASKEYIDACLAETDSARIDLINAKMDEFDPDWTPGFIGAMEKSLKDRDEWEDILNELKGQGFSNAVIERFRETGAESGMAWAKSLFEEMTSFDKQLPGLIDKADQAMAEWKSTPKNSEEEIAAKERYYAIIDEINALHDAKQARVEYVNGLVKDSSKTSVMTKNMKEENDAHDAFLKNVSDLRKKIAELKKEGHTATARYYQTVLDEILKGGYENADALQGIMDSIASSASFASKEVLNLAKEIDRRNKKNSENTWASLKDGQKQAKATQKEYEELYTWITKNTFTASSVKNSKGKSLLTKEQRQKALGGLQDQINSMGVDEAIAYMEAIKYGAESHKYEFAEWQSNFFQSNFSIPESVASTVTADYAAVATGNMDAFSKASVAQSNKVATDIMKAISTNMSSVSKTNKEVAKELKATGKTVSNAVKKEAEKQISDGAKPVIKGFSGKMKKAATYKSVKADLTDTGKAIDDGLAEGISDNGGVVKKAAVNVAKGALKAAKKQLGINSPSKEFAKLGAYSIEGFAVGMDDTKNVAMASLTTMANDIIAYMAGAMSMVSDQVASGVSFDPEFVVDESKTKALDSMRQAIESMILLANNEIDTNPIITPEMDLTDVRKSAQEINSMIDDNISKVNGPTVDGAIQSGSNSGVTYIQNNYSPKALSPLEIYRQSENLISRTRGMVRRL